MRETQRVRRWVGWVALALVAGACTAAPPAQRPIDTTGRPNIVFLLVDDLDSETMAHLPRLRSLLAERGTTFANAFVDVSLCCPSRTSILRGQYGHNTQILTNVPPSGGFERVHQLRLERSTIATWLHDAGYRTALLGKYLNGYPATVSPGYVPPGWDVWASPTAGTPYSEFNYTLNENGTLIRRGHEAGDYLVDVLADKGSAFVRADVGVDGVRRQPLFLYLAPFVPHQPAVPAPRYESSFAGISAPRTPSFDEPDVSDKPAWVRQPRLTEAMKGAIDDLYRRRLQAMLGVEDMVQRLLDALTETKQLDNTYFFFFSDNGFHLGQHRLPPGKQTAYEEDVRVPLVVRGPGVPAGATRSELVVNVDFAPTFAELGRASAPDFVDGRSLLPLLSPHPPPASWRHAVLIEHGSMPRPAQQAQPSATARPTATRPAATSEPPDAQDDAGVSRTIPVYQAVRTARYAYIEYVTGEKELYDLARDPAELESLHATAAPELLSRLAGLLDALRHCAGRTCGPTEDGAAP